MSNLAAHPALLPTTAGFPGSLLNSASLSRHIATKEEGVGDARLTSVEAMLNRLRSCRELKLEFDAEKRILWWTMAPIGRPSFTPGMLKEMHVAGDALEQVCPAGISAADAPVRYLVLGSEIPNIFNLGGDLRLFSALIEAGDRAALRRYARSCAEGQHRLDINFDRPLCTIALVRGDALGGGFEMALAHDYIIAERRTRFGLPEILFNLFPGMGAFNFLSRRMDVLRAERMILSGRTYTAEEMYEMGVIDVLADDGEGADAVYRFVNEFERARRTRQAVLQARRLVHPVGLDALLDIADLWVDAALALSPQDIRRMQHLAKAQDRRLSRVEAERAGPERVSAGGR